MLNQIITGLTKQIEELQAENRKLRDEARDYQQIAYLKNYINKRLETKCEKAIRECKILEQALENCADQIEARPRFSSVRADKMFKKYIDEEVSA